MIEKLIHIISLLGSWAYLVIFFASFLESAAFMGFLVPGETIVVLSGFLAFQGYLKLGDCISTITLGAVLGDAVGYIIGKTVGKDYFERHNRLLFLKEKHIQKTNEYFQRHGGKTVFLGRFIGLLRAMVPFTAGISKMPFGKFFLYNIAGGVSWAVTFTLLGYFFGQSWQLIERWCGRAGLFVFFVVMSVLGFGCLYKKVVESEKALHEWFRGKYSAILLLPFVRRFIERNPKLVAFIKERLSPESYLGLHLTIGLALSIIFVWIFGGITEDVLSGDPLVVVDQWVLNGVLYFQTPSVTKFMIIFTQLSANLAITAGSLGVIIYSLFKKRFDYLATYLFAIGGGSILVFALKMVVHRRRPISEIPLIKVGGWSFPSGHAMMSVIFYGLITYVLVRKMQSWRLRVFVVLAAGFVVFLVGLSRIYLQVHYLSDVLAGYMGGLFWLSICIVGLEIYRKRR